MAKRTKKAKRDTYQEVTDRIVAAFEEGDLSKWSRPWKTVGLHKSANSGKDYRGVNQWILMLTAMSRGFASNLWLTYKQAKAFGGHVRKGEKGTQVVFWKWGEKERTDAEGNPVLDSKGQPKKERVLLYATSYTVFNTDQCEGLNEEKLDKHRITAYVATLTHELTHWTGAKHRLDREFGKRFGDSAYAVEELVAEMGSAFLCAKFGVEGQLQHPEYISHWVKVLKADKGAIFTAASKAQKAVDFLDECQAERAELEAQEAEEVACRAA